VDITCRRI